MMTKSILWSEGLLSKKKSIFIDEINENKSNRKSLRKNHPEKLRKINSIHFAASRNCSITEEVSNFPDLNKTIKESERSNASSSKKQSTMMITSRIFENAAIMPEVVTKNKEKMILAAKLNEPTIILECKKKELYIFLNIKI